MQLQFGLSNLFDLGYMKFRSDKVEEACRKMILYPRWPMATLHLSWSSPFCRACVDMHYLTEFQMARAAIIYQLGMSRDGGVIFWQFGPLEDVYDGKIMYYKPDCHRDHHRHPTWVSSVIKPYCDYDYDLQNLPRCLFGTHLLHGSPKTTTVAVVESEKTAVIMSGVFPQYIWLAAGGLNMLKPVMFCPLQDHKIIVFPDTDPDGKSYQLWYDIVQKAKRAFNLSITVSPILEKKASAEQKAAKIDLVDFLFDSKQKSS